MCFLRRERARYMHRVHVVEKNARKYGRSIQYFTMRLCNNRSRIRDHYRAQLDTHELSEIALQVYSVVRLIGARLRPIKFAALKSQARVL